jgi:hypothetical protein
MIVNPSIKQIYREISEQTVRYNNTPDKDRRYIKRFVHIFKNELSEDEQIYLAKSLLESLNYRNIVTDPDNVLLLHNIRLRSVTYVFFVVASLMLLGAALYKTNDTLNGILEALSNVLKLLSI